MAKPIMIQGTMSGVGKSLLAAGLCRIFSQDGYRTAPFKSQNMALNSFVTAEGLEMGRAQVMQAEAAGIEPSVRMNPILLKPTSDVGSQVIVNGEVLSTMNARDYFRYKKNLIPDILNAYRSLDEEYDVIVLEGAGSPAEINLKSDDIVNMGMAKMAGAPVLLAGDIDRGGVFAQLIGTAELLEPDERAMVKGLIVNKFRGDKTILDPGIRMLEEKSGIPVIGVVPFMELHLEEEDSLSERLEHRKEDGQIDIAVIRFPRISNYNDLDPLETYAGVSVRYILDHSARNQKHHRRSSVDETERTGGRCQKVCCVRRTGDRYLRRISDARAAAAGSLRRGSAKTMRSKRHGASAGENQLYSAEDPDAGPWGFLFVVRRFFGAFGGTALRI